MKKTSRIILIVVFGVTLLSFYKVEAISTGDLQMDRELQYLNDTAKSDLRDFSMRLSRHYDADAGIVDRLIHKAGMAPADVYMAAKVRRLAHRSWDEVIREYQENNEKGWGVIAKNLGIKPGSREFHELKNDDSGIIAWAKGKKDKGSKEKGNKSKGKDKSKKDKKK